jgi:putative glutamine amidotransferase
VHEVPGLGDHREDPQAAVEVQYGPAHAVQLSEGGWLVGWAGAPTTTVNSVHGQGIDRLADGLRVEAIAADGLIEAARSTAHRFVPGVQWHPEWRVADNRFYHSIFHAFGDACRRNSLTADRS